MVSANVTFQAILEIFGFSVAPEVTMYVPKYVHMLPCTSHQTERQIDCRFFELHNKSHERRDS